MSEYGDLFTSFYNQFVLRDLLSIVFPGFFVIITTLFFIGRRFHIYSIFSTEISLLLVFLILGFSYFIGILFLFLSDATGFCKTYYTDKSIDMRKRTKAFHEKLETGYWHKEGIKEKFANIRERYIIFMQACGNMAWASLSILIICLITFFMHQHLIFLLFVIPLCLSNFGYCHFRKYLQDWDKLFLNNTCMTSYEDSCKKIFYELKDKELISPCHEIKATERCNYFHAGLLTIHYNPEMNTKLDENSIRISLLHEEAHIRFICRTILFLVFLFVVLLLLVFINFDLLLKILFTVIIIFLFWLFFLIEEYKCDEFASIKIRDNYDLSTPPSVILKIALDKMPYSLLSKFTHPRAHQRVDNIVNKVDKK